MKIGIQTGRTVAELGAAQTYRMYREVGFEALDWNIDTAVKRADLKSGNYLGASILERPLEEILAYYHEELEAIAQNGLIISQAHAPFPAYLPGREDVLDYMIGIYRNCIALCQHLRIKNLVVHGITWFKEEKNSSQAQIDALNRKLYTSLIPDLVQTDVTVCMENLFHTYRGITYMGHCSNAELAVQFLDEMNALAGKECFGLCFDTGHLQLLKQDSRVYLATLGKRVKALHIHDNDGISDLHMAPYTGSFVWSDLYEMLARIGYDGDLCFETFRQTSLENVEEAEMVAPWFRLIADCGRFFRKKILEGRA